MLKWISQQPKTNMILKLRPNLKQVFPIGVFIFAFLCFFGAQSVSAKTFTYPSYNVDIVVNEDSTVDVNETLTYKFTGSDFHGVIRQITLDSRENSDYCRNADYTCGGFDNLSLTGVYDSSGTLVPVGQYETYIEDNEDAGKTYFTIKWTLWPNGKTFQGENFTWSIRYRLYGSLGWIGTSRTVAVPYLYWNVLPEEKGGAVDRTTVTITLPTGVQATTAKLAVYSDKNISYDAQAQENKITISSENLSSYSEFTVAYELPRDSIQRPATVTYTSYLPWTGLQILLDGAELSAGNFSLQNFPLGKHTIEFAARGYESTTYEINAKEGELIQLDATLTPSVAMIILLLCCAFLSLLGIFLIPGAIIYVYRKWKNSGRDIDMPKTIIPIFSPPEGIKPYLLGALKDERVDQEDITGSIIDLAYRGYIKIKELQKNTNYELTRLEGKSADAGLNDFEKQLLEDLFQGAPSVETKKMGAKFYLKYPALKNKIYQELVSQGYFEKSPETVRAQYAGLGSATCALGIGLSIGLGLAGMAIMGVLGPVPLGVALIVLGIMLLVVSGHMPAKTAAGSKVYAGILGFRMYMYTAERFRVQNLKPEDFERYLSYAIVFGIEKEWAEKFKDIYKGQPDWYESSTNIYDVFWVSQFTRSFATAMTTSVYSYGASSGRGSGWSGGGGSFGGFSGGGGGGGSSGAF
jgi:hypothetical protein